MQRTCKNVLEMQRIQGFDNSMRLWFYFSVFRRLILTGGEFLKGTYSLIGNAAEYSLEQYRTAISGVSGILVDEGCFSVIPQEAEIKRLMSLNSRETIVVSDSSKIGSRAFCFVCDFAHVDKLVTDRNFSKSALEKLTQKGAEVFTV